MNASGKGVDVQGSILIIDGVATHRIMLKVLLSAACYRVSQLETLDGFENAVRRTNPDLIITARSLPDGNAEALRCRLLKLPEFAQVPILALLPQNDRAGRLNMLDAGIDDAMHLPLDDTILQARIRNLIRKRSLSDELRQTSVATYGFAEAPTAFLPAITARVALVSDTAQRAVSWRSRLQNRVPYTLSTHSLHDIAALMSDPVPEAIVVGLNPADPAPALSLIADLKARATTRNTVVVAVPDPTDPGVSARALDLGADDALPYEFCVAELVLRLRRLLRRKARQDHLRDTMRSGIEAATTDFLTKLHNRRYLRHGIEKMTCSALEHGRHFAFLIADLDHFKSINDTFGHPAGDAVLVETARRLKSAVGNADIVARVGGEEFVIALPDTNVIAARQMAQGLCHAIGREPFDLPGSERAVHVTASIGVVLGPLISAGQQAAFDSLMFAADKALYVAKNSGRNRVELARLSA